MKKTKEEFYQSKPWKRVRPKILRRDGYECQECKRYGKTKAATCVHHIIPLELCLIFASFLALLGINLISLCDKCHDAMHDRTNNVLTMRGKQLFNRKKELAQYKWIIEKEGKVS